MKTLIQNLFYLSLLFIFSAMGSPTALYGQAGENAFERAFVSQTDTAGNKTCFEVINEKMVPVPCHEMDAWLSQNHRAATNKLSNEVPALQPQGEGQEITVDTLVDKWTYFMALILNAMMFLMGLLNKLFPKFVLFKNDRTKDLVVKFVAGAAVVGWLLINNGFVNSWQLGIGFVIAVFQYKEVLKPAGLKTFSAATKKAG